MKQSARLLGFAFANSDFLFEIDAQGTILFTAGAANDLVREASEVLVGRPATVLFKRSETATFVGLTNGLKSGGRAGPVKLTLSGGNDAYLAMFRLPANGGAISCTLSKLPENKYGDINSRTGFATRDGFLAAAAAGADENDVLTLVDVPGLAALYNQLPHSDADLLMKRIGTSLQQADIKAVGRISDSRFGAVAPAQRGPLGLAKRIAGAFSAGGYAVPAIKEERVSLWATDLLPEQRMLALRYVVDQFAAKGKSVAPDGGIASAFAQVMDQTQTRLSALTKTVGDGTFEIAYQPIKDLASGKVSHYEALARFTNPEGTGETVKFIEALGIANAFDLAVANKVLSIIEQGGANGPHIAFNISGATIASPASFGVLAAILARSRKLAPRTLIEITETATIADLEAAGKAIGALRAMGYRVGLDDFGAGAASINYLHAFAIDFVKFDGAMIKKIGSSKRHDCLMSGLAKLCSETGVTTIAEWIESDEMAQAARVLGFDHGQGKWLGAPQLKPPFAQITLGKRKGVTESWG